MSSVFDEKIKKINSLLNFIKFTLQKWMKLSYNGVST